MVLNRKTILKLIDERKLVIDPFDKSAVGVASIELRLKPEFGVFGSRGHGTQPSTNTLTTVPWKNVHEYDLEHGVRVVGQTLERITLPDDVCGWVTPKARTALFDLSVEISTGFVQPGTKGEHLFFVIANNGQAKLPLRNGTRICQLVLSRVGSQ